MYANNKGADQPAHLLSLISAFIICSVVNIIIKPTTCKILIFQLVSVAVQTRLSPTWSETQRQVFRGAAGSSLIGVTALCPWARQIYPSLVLVQTRKTRPYITERLLMGPKESNQTKRQVFLLRGLYTRVKVFRIIPEFRILRLALYRNIIKSASKC